MKFDQCGCSNWWCGGEPTRKGVAAKRWSITAAAAATGKTLQETYQIHREWRGTVPGPTQGERVRLAAGGTVLRAGDPDAAKVPDTDWPPHLTIVPGATAGAFLPGAAQLKKLQKLLKVTVVSEGCVTDFLHENRRWTISDLVEIAAKLGCKDFKRSATEILESLRVIDVLCPSSCLSKPPSEIYKVMRLMYQRWAYHHFYPECVPEETPAGQALRNKAGAKAWALLPTVDRLRTLSEIRSAAVWRQRQASLARLYPPSVAEQAVLEKAAAASSTRPRLSAAAADAPLYLPCPGTIVSEASCTKLKHYVAIFLRQCETDMKNLFFNHEAEAAAAGIHAGEGGPIGALISGGKIGTAQHGWRFRTKQEVPPKTIATLFGGGEDLFIRSTSCAGVVCAASTACPQCKSTATTVRTKILALAASAAVPVAPRTRNDRIATSPNLAWAAIRTFKQTIRKSEDRSRRLERALEVVKRQSQQGILASIEVANSSIHFLRSAERVVVDPHSYLPPHASKMSDSSPALDVVLPPGSDGRLLWDTTIQNMESWKQTGVKTGFRYPPEVMKVAIGIYSSAGGTLMDSLADYLPGLPTSRTTKRYANQTLSTEWGPMLTAMAAMSKAREDKPWKEGDGQGCLTWDGMSIRQGLTYQISTGAIVGAPIDHPSLWVVKET